MFEIKIRSALKKDKMIFFNWVNDPENIKYKVRTKSKISLEKHNLWFNQILSNKKNFLYIIQHNNNLLGQIRLNYISKKKYEIDIYVTKEFRGRNVATNALSKAEKKITDGATIFAIVKKNNLASLSFFKKNGYRLYSENHEKWSLKKNL